MLSLIDSALSVDRRKAARRSRHIRFRVAACIQPPNERSWIASSNAAGFGSKLVSRRASGSRRNADGSMSDALDRRPPGMGRHASSATSGVCAAGADAASTAASRGDGIGETIAAPDRSCCGRVDGRREACASGGMRIASTGTASDRSIQITSSTSSARSARGSGDTGIRPNPPISSRVGWAYLAHHCSNGTKTNNDRKGLFRQKRWAPSPPYGRGDAYADFVRARLMD